MQESVNAESSKIFTDVKEAEITRAIVNEFHSVLIDRIESDVIVIGSGPAGLTASMELANMGFKVLTIEQNNYLGGGYWLGGYMMNPVTVREPAQKLWDELGVPYKKSFRRPLPYTRPSRCFKTYCRCMRCWRKISKFNKI